MAKNKTKQFRSVADKIRQFRDEFTQKYTKTHKKFDIHQFTKEFLKRPKAENT